MLMQHVSPKSAYAGPCYDTTLAWDVKEGFQSCSIGLQKTRFDKLVNGNPPSRLGPPE